MPGRPGHDDDQQHAAERRALIADIVRKVARFGTGDGERALDPKVLDAMGKVPREKFVPAMDQAEAYANRPLPIGHRQTISQPLVVALMTHHLRLQPSDRVLEIGTGSGYQTAVLAEIAEDIVTIENVHPLAEQAKTTLEGLGYRNIRFIERDGRMGAPEHAPFDRILVTAAASALPGVLLDQLAADGRLVAPIGERGGQQLVLATKSAAGEIEERKLFPVAFVPLTFGHS